MKKSEDQLWTIIGNIPALAGSCRADGTAEFINQRWLDYTGRSLEESLGWGWSVAVHPEDLGKLRDTWLRHLASGEPVEAEARLRRFDGEYRWFLFRAAPVRDDQGNVVRWYAINTDIEDRKRGEEALRASDLHFRQFVDGIPALVAVMNAAGEVELVNRQVLEYFGKTLEELKNWATGGAVHRDDLSGVVAAWRRSVETGHPYESEHRQRRADGVYRWFHARALPLRDAEGRVFRWYVLQTDIDDRKRAESLLSAEKRSLEMISGGASLNAILEDLCNTIDAEASDVISSVLLMDPDGKRLWPGAGPRVPPKYIDAIVPVTIGPGVGSCGTAAFRKKQVIVSDIAADPLWAPFRDIAVSNGLRAAWSQPLVSKDNQVLGTFCTYYAQPRSPSSSDLRLIEGAGHIALIAIQAERSQAARKEAEDALRDAQADLARVTRMTTMGELVASIAHEVNQPLMAIVTNAETCLSWLASDPPQLDEARKAAGRIVRDGHRAGDIIKTIRALARKSRPEMTDLDLNDVIAEVLVLTRGELRRHDVSLETELSGGLEPVMGDRIQVQQVLLNLVMNGIEAMNAIMDRPRVLRVSSQIDGPGSVLIAVTDTGTGFDPTKVDRIFDAFFTTKPEGMGMGLSICRSIVEAHGGRLWASPNPPHGSVFQFTMPV
jgi:PAS domain S-box-containing protein